MIENDDVVYSSLDALIDTIKYILNTVFLFFIFYLIGSFMNASFDISTWDDFGRVVIGLFGGTVSLIYLISKYFRKKEI